MNAIDLLRDLERRRIYLQVVYGDRIRATGASRLSDSDRDWIRDHKASLLQLLRPTESLDPEAAALGEAYVAAMRSGVELPPLASLSREQVKDLLGHPYTTTTRGHASFGEAS